jgi:CheY-like chemotaxis protein
VITDTELLAARILIVDDLEADVRLLEQTLRGAGYTNVTSTLDGTTVCALHREHAYDLILLDMVMPEMDGFAILEALRALEASRSVPVLVLTAAHDNKLRALQSGARDFITKPFDLVEAKARVRNLLEVRLLQRQVERHNAQLEQAVLERTAELRASEERFHRFVELSSDWYWEQDAAGRYTSISGPALEILGIGIGDGGDATLQENIAARRPFLDYVCTRLAADGTRQFFQISGEPFFGPNGAYAGYRGIGMDVTERMSRWPGAGAAQSQ